MSLLDGDLCQVILFYGRLTVYESTCLPYKYVELPLGTDAIEIFFAKNDQHYCSECSKSYAAEQLWPSFECKKSEMRKILFGLDDSHFSQEAFLFLEKFNQAEEVLAIGMYIPAILDDLQRAISRDEAAFYAPRLIDEDEAIVRSGIPAFKDACAAHGIKYSVHSDSGTSILQAIRKETRFADLFIIAMDTYFSDKFDVFAEDELRQIVENSECPVLLVPRQSSLPDNIIIAYDGTPGSVHALKMFSYIFPAMVNQPVTIMHAGASATRLPDEDLVKELSACHFTKPAYTVLGLNPKKYFVTWMEDHPKALLVTGAYGRPELSQLFKRSFIHKLLEQHPIPVFIAHK